MTSRHTLIVLTMLLAVTLFLPLGAYSSAGTSKIHGDTPILFQGKTAEQWTELLLNDDADMKPIAPPKNIRNPILP